MLIQAYSPARWHQLSLQLCCWMWSLPQCQNPTCCHHQNQQLLFQTMPGSFYQNYNHDFCITNWIKANRKQRKQKRQGHNDCQNIQRANQGKEKYYLIVTNNMLMLQTWKCGYFPEYLTIDNAQTDFKMLPKEKWSKYQEQQKMKTQI